MLAQGPAREGLTRTQELLADDPLWLILIKVVALFALGVVLTLFMINWERKVVGRMQQRPGPNRVGPGGWLQSLADGLKLAFKEDIMPVHGRQAGLLHRPGHLHASRRSSPSR